MRPIAQQNNYYNFWRKISSFASLYIRKKIFDLFMKEISPTEKDSVLDLGITADIIHQADNYFEKFYPFPQNITGAGIEDLSALKKIYPGMKIIQADGRNLPFENNSFDILFSGAVLEHVGSREDQKKFINESLRVGKKVFITTPNRNFPIEAHTGLLFLHYLPYKFYRRLLKVFGLDFFAQEENLNLLTGGDLRDLFKNCNNVEFRSIKLLFLPLILIAIKK